MEIKLFEDFLCLSETRNFSRAAEARHITQSTLSKRIRSLEHWVGAKLIDRSSYPVELTPRGNAMVPQARELVSMFQGMRAGIRALATPPPNAVSIGSLHTLRVTFLPEFRASIEAKTGPWALEHQGSSAAYAQTLRDFRNGETDMVLTYVHPSVTMGLDPEHYDSLKLGRDQVVPVSAPDEEGNPMHSLDTGGIVKLLSYGSSSFFGQALVPLLAARPLALNVTASNAMCIGLQSLAKVGCGVAWLPLSLVRDDLADGSLVVAGDREWFLDLEIRLFRPRARCRPIVERIWRTAQELQASNAIPVLHPRLAAVS